MIGMTFLERIGGQHGLETILADFYRRVSADPMIGFLFKGKDLGRLVALEVQFTARAFGASIDYEGRGMRLAHAALRVSGGQFDRRMRILEETLRDHAVGADVVEAWLGHGRALRRAVVVDACEPPTASGAGLTSVGRSP